MSYDFIRRHVELHHHEHFELVDKNAPGYQIKVLERRINQLELLEQQRRTRELILYALIASYSIFRVAKWFISR